MERAGRGTRQPEAQRREPGTDVTCFTRYTHFTRYTRHLSYTPIASIYAHHFRCTPVTSVPHQAALDYDKFIRAKSVALLAGRPKGEHGKATIEQRRRGKVYMEEMLRRARKPLNAPDEAVLREAEWTQSHFTEDGSCASGFTTEMAKADAEWFEQAQVGATAIQSAWRGKSARKKSVGKSAKKRNRRVSLRTHACGRGRCWGA